MRPQDSSRTRLLPGDSLRVRLSPEDSLRAALRDSVRADSTRQDSLRARLITDSTYVVYLDSTARLRQFAPKRIDPVGVEVIPDRTYPLFGARKSSGLRREFSLDTAGANVRIRETMFGEDTRIPISIPLSEYISLRRSQEFRRLLAEEARKPKALAAKNDLGELLSNITQIQIPIPPNPIFSIFGKPEIRLNISGSVDIKAGFRSTQTDQTTIPAWIRAGTNRTSVRMCR